MEYNSPPKVPFNCSNDDEEGIAWREYSASLFSKAKNWEEVVKLWVKFYSNSICLPGSFGPWVGSTDNPHATFEIGKHYANLSIATGLLFDDGQQGNIKDRQREYLSGFAPASCVSIIRSICEELNRHPGLVAFWWFQANEGGCDINSFWVTYKDYDENESLIWTGKPVTRAINVTTGPQFLMEWLNPKLEATLTSKGFIGFEFIDTIHGQNRIVPTIENLLKNFKK